GHPAPGLVRLNADGSVDPTFVSPVRLVPSFPFARLTLKADTLYVLGTFRHPESVFPKAIWKIKVQ
ncbi:MAG: delta-60 repeat domain-containing protein, partial [Verrucomicrobiota bacterium]